jgi:other hect domain ubiquitin protein ligase E3
VYELTKKLNLQLETKELEFEKPASQLLANPQHPVLLLIQKLGRMIAIEQEHTSIEAAIQRELAICQSKNRPQRSSKKQQPPISDDRKYKVLVQVSDDEEISHLVRVLYYWEELYPAITPRLARTIEEYHELREREKKRDDHKIESKDAVLQGGAPPAENKQAQQAKALQ